MNKHLLTPLLFVALAFLQIWYFYIAFSRPYIGIDLQNKEEHWIVSHVDTESNGLPQGALRVDDEIVAVNGQKTDQFSSVIKLKVLEGAKSIVGLRAGAEFKVEVRTTTLLTHFDVLSFTGELLCFVVAALVYARMSHIRSARYLSFVFWAIGGAFMSLAASTRGDELGKSFIFACVVLVPVALFHFFVVFFEDKGRKLVRDWVIRLMYAFAIVTFLPFVFVSVVRSDSAYEIYNYSKLLSISLFTVGVLSNLIYLTGMYLKLRKEDKEIRMIIRTIGVVFLLSFMPLICFSFIPKLVFGGINTSSIYTAWAILLFPLSFTYLLASRKLYDIDLVVQRFVTSMLISIVPSALFVGVIALRFHDEVDASRLFVLFLLFVVLLACTVYSYEYFTTKLEHIIFPRRYRLKQSMKKIAGNLGQISTFNDLKDIVLVDILETLQVYGGAIVFLHKDNKEIIHVGNIDISEAERLAEAESPEHPTYMRQKITRNEEYACYLIMTQKKSNTFLGIEETQWLDLVMSYLSVSMENLHLIRKITIQLEQFAAKLPPEKAAAEIAWFRKLMFELQEKERKRIAIDLHDSTMQDLFYLKRRCAGLFDNHDSNPEENPRLKAVLNFIDVINMNLRQNCFELHPYLLKEIGLIGTIEKQISLEAVIAPFKIEFRATGTSEIEGCDMEMKQHLFRIVQELLNNAKKHSHASHVKIDIVATNSRLTLAYVDDGIGFDTTETVEREIIGSRVGMEYMKSRILSLNGLYELNSSKGNGMKLKAVFPVKEQRTAY
ncbi:sensor histidine kinase [Cohnella soli]|uniref:ATP-binding protein n=1 Tax=Cohnella soli TaxID=425005 RepID=A0ABW0HZW6_9BACL